MKITITRALAEVKSLQNRIDKGINNLTPFEVSIGERLKGPHSSMKISDFNEEIKEEFQSVKDLIRRQMIIKNAIDKSNHETIVKVGGKEMTIAEVLIEKSLVIPNESNMKARVERELLLNRRAFDSAIQSNKEWVEKMVDKQISDSTSSGKTTKVEKDDILAEYSAMVEKSSKVELQDPAKAQEWLKEIESKLDEYNNEVDYVLSESNSTTFIEIPD